MMEETLSRGLSEEAIVPIFVLHVDAAGDLALADMNPACEKATGLRKEDVVGKRIEEAPNLTKAGAVRLQEECRRCLDTGELVEYEGQLESSTGIRSLHVLLMPVRGASGTIERIVGVVHDLSEHEQAGRDLQRSHDLLQAIIEAAPPAIRRAPRKAREHQEQARRTSESAFEELFNKAAVPLCFVNKEKGTLRVNARYETVFGYTRDEIATLDEWWQLAYPDPTYRKLVLDKCSAEIQRAVETDTDIEPIEYDVTCKNGDVRTMVVFGSFIGQDLLLTFFDVTERKQAEAELILYRDRLEDLVQQRTAELEIARNKAQQYLDVAGVILVALGTDRRVTMINQKGCEILGGTAAEIIGTDWFETFVPEGIRQDVVREYGRLLSGERQPVGRYENPVLTRDSGERLVAWQNVVLRDSDGRITGTLSSGEDITQRRRAEEQIMELNRDLRERTRLLEESNAELAAFAYSVSHDLRAPLRHIDGFVELLQKKAGTALDPQSQHYMDTIADSAKRMSRLVEGLLSFSRLGRQAMSLRNVELQTLVLDVMRELEPAAAGRKVDWHIGDLPAVDGDATLLRVVFSNLISNALKFTSPRQPARIEIGSLPARSSEAVIFVRDNGVGFDMAYSDKLFGVFQRLHHADEFEGTGIGLANVRRIIARHGGRTWAEGELDRGATIFFALPRVPQGAGKGDS